MKNCMVELQGSFKVSEQSCKTALLLSPASLGKRLDYALALKVKTDMTCFIGGNAYTIYEAAQQYRVVNGLRI